MFAETTPTPAEDADDDSCYYDRPFKVNDLFLVEEVSDNGIARALDSILSCMDFSHGLNKSQPRHLKRVIVGVHGYVPRKNNTHAPCLTASGDIAYDLTAVVIINALDAKVVGVVPGHRGILALTLHKMYWNMRLVMIQIGVQKYKPPPPPLAGKQKRPDEGLDPPATLVSDLTSPPKISDIISPPPQSKKRKSASSSSSSSSSSSGRSSSTTSSGSEVPKDLKELYNVLAAIYLKGCKLPLANGKIEFAPVND